MCFNIDRNVLVFIKYLLNANISNYRDSNSLPDCFQLTKPDVAYLKAEREADTTPTHDTHRKRHIFDL